MKRDVRKGDCPNKSHYVDEVLVRLGAERFAVSVETARKRMERKERGKR